MSRCGLMATPISGVKNHPKIVAPKIITNGYFSNFMGLKKLQKNSKIEKNFENMLKACLMIILIIRNKKKSVWKKSKFFYVQL